MKKLLKSHAHIATLLCSAVLIGTTAAKADQVIPDDLIVQGSACVGLDCVNNESFGFSTLRLKENNTRIEFLDTSTSAGFPSNDWMITANDSASGGANYLAFDDITGGRQPFRVTAGAPTASLFVDSTGRVGLRTSTPVLDVHINTSNTPAHRLEQNNSGGFTAQTWDVAGNEANFFVRDVTGGSRLPFRIRPGAPTSSIDINAAGAVGIGTASPAGKLHLFGNQNVDIVLEDTAVANARWRILPQTTNATKLFRIVDDTANANRLVIDANGNVALGLTSVTSPNIKLDVNGAIRSATLNTPGANTMCFDGSNIIGFCSSDERLKRDVQYLADNTGIAAVMQLKPVAFKWQDSPDRQMAGFMAQDTQRAMPAAVHQPAGAEFLSFDSNAVLAYTVKAVQELKAENETLRAELQRLKSAR